MLAVTLFVIYFCVASLFIYEPDTKAFKAPKTSENKSFDDFYRSIKETIGREEEPDFRDISPQTVAEPPFAPEPHSSHFTIHKLRKLVCQRGLQGSLGKPVNRCCKEELFAVLFA
jgi:hypothetical protein